VSRVGVWARHGSWSSSEADHFVTPSTSVRALTESVDRDEIVLRVEVVRFDLPFGPRSIYAIAMSQVNPQASPLSTAS
jgi:hypothetical protein